MREGTGHFCFDDHEEQYPCAGVACPAAFEQSGSGGFSWLDGPQGLGGGRLGLWTQAAEAVVTSSLAVPGHTAAAVSQALRHTCTSRPQM